MEIICHASTIMYNLHEEDIEAGFKVDPEIFMDATRLMPDIAIGFFTGIVEGLTGIEIKECTVIMDNFFDELEEGVCCITLVDMVNPENMSILTKQDSVIQIHPDILSAWVDACGIKIELPDFETDSLDEEGDEEENVAEIPETVIETTTTWRYFNNGFDSEDSVRNIVREEVAKGITKDASKPRSVKEKKREASKRTSENKKRARTFTNQNFELLNADSVLAVMSEVSPLARYKKELRTLKQDKKTKYYLTVAIPENQDGEKARLWLSEYAKPSKFLKGNVLSSNLNKRGRKTKRS